jgi:hypothetical protein
MIDEIGATTVEEIEAEVMSVRERMGDWEPPSNKLWLELANPHLVNVRMAFLTVKQNREKARETAAAFKEMEVDGENGLERVLDDMLNSAAYFACLTEVLSTAARRLAVYAPESEAAE